MQKTRQGRRQYKAQHRVRKKTRQCRRLDKVKDKTRHNTRPSETYHTNLGKVTTGGRNSALCLGVGDARVRVRVTENKSRQNTRQGRTQDKAEHNTRHNTRQGTTQDRPEHKTRHNTRQG